MVNGTDLKEALGILRTSAENKILEELQVPKIIEALGSVNNFDRFDNAQFNTGVIHIDIPYCTVNGAILNPICLSAITKYFLQHGLILSDITPSNGTDFIVQVAEVK